MVFGSPPSLQLLRALEVVDVNRAPLGSGIATDLDAVISRVQVHRDRGGIRVGFPTTRAVVSDRAALDPIHVDAPHTGSAVTIAAMQFELIGTAAGSNAGHLAIGTHIVEPTHGRPTRSVSAGITAPIVMRTTVAAVAAVFGFALNNARRIRLASRWI